MTNQESPFADRSMIKQRDRFFGRTAEKFAIFNALAAPKPQCVSIIGERRIGRSSLLWHIKQVYREMLPNAQRYHFAYLDLARDACTTPDQFYAEVAQAFFKQRHNHLTPHQFDDFMTEQRTADQKLILLLDEFNILQRRKDQFSKDQFNDDFYDGLRARANAGELTYVLASHLPLAQIAVENDFTSTFFGIFTSVSLGEFTTEDARASFLRPVPNELSPANFAIVSRWLNKKYHPLKLRLRFGPQHTQTSALGKYQGISEENLPSHHCMS